MVALQWAYRIPSKRRPWKVHEITVLLIGRSIKGKLWHTIFLLRKDDPDTDRSVVYLKLPHMTIGDYATCLTKTVPQTNWERDCESILMIRPAHIHRFVMVLHWASFIWLLTCWFWMQVEYFSDVLPSLPLIAAPYFLVMFAVWLKQKRWVWFPWQHSKPSKLNKNRA